MANKIKAKVVNIGGNGMPAMRAAPGMSSPNVEVVNITLSLLLDDAEGIFEDAQATNWVLPLENPEYPLPFNYGDIVTITVDKSA